MYMPTHYTVIDFLVCLAVVVLWHRLGYSYDMHWSWKFYRGMGALIMFFGLFGVTYIFLLFLTRHFGKKFLLNSFIMCVSIVAFTWGLAWLLEYSIQRYRRSRAL